VRTRFAFAAIAVAALGCSEKRAKPSPPASALVSASAEALPAARRPTRRYFLARTVERCEIYAEDPGGTTPKTPTPCPDYVHVGERLRVTGMTCMRESDDPNRVQPVVCPDALQEREKRDRAERRD
jgi:hypothetical protein